MGLSKAKFSGAQHFYVKDITTTKYQSFYVKENTSAETIIRPQCVLITVHDVNKVIIADIIIDAVNIRCIHHAVNNLIHYGLPQQLASESKLTMEWFACR